MVKYYLLLLLFFSNYHTQAQIVKPGFTPQQTLAEKVEAWRIYCNQMLGYNEAGITDYKQLTIAAKQGLAMLPEDSTRLRAMFQLFAGCGYENLNRYDSAVYHLETSARLAKSINKTNYEITALSRLNYVYGYLRQTAKIKPIIDRMQVLANTSGALSDKELAISALAGYYIDINDYGKAIEYKIQSYNLYKEVLKKDSLLTKPINLGYDLCNIANLFNQIGNHTKAIEYLEEARPYLAGHELKDDEESFYLYFTQAYLGVDRLDSARHYYNLIYKGMAGRDTLYSTMSTANLLMGEFFLSQNEMDSALSYAKKCHRLSLLAPEKGAYVESCKLLGQVFYKSGKYSQALEQIRIALQNDFEFDTQALADLHKTMADCFGKIGKWDSAYYHLGFHNTLNDSLMLAAANSNFANAEARFMNSERKQQIANQKLALQLAGSQRKWLIMWLAVAVLGSLLLWLNARNRNRHSRQLNVTNNALQQANNALDESNKTKAKLFSIISHDLRSPISQVHQFLNLQQLNPHALNEQQKTEIGKQIQGATGQLLETMEDLLLWSKTQLNSFETRMQPVELIPVIEACIHLLQLNIRAKQLTLDYDVKPGTITITDENYLQTILRNLLQNAVNASPTNATINISTSEQPGSTHIVIRNQGIHFSQHQYLTAINNNSTISNLNGLGMRLVHELSEKIGATISYADTGDNKTEVHVQLPGS